MSFLQVNQQLTHPTTPRLGLVNLANPDFWNLDWYGYRGQFNEPGAGEDPKKVNDFVHAESRKWGDLIRSAGIKAD